MSHDPKDPKDQKDQKPQQTTRLNAELAYQYGRTTTPGRSALTDGATRKKRRGEGDDVGAVDGAEAEAEGELEVAVPSALEPKQSIFELPRREPLRQPLPGSPFTAASAGTTADTPDTPAPPSSGTKPKR